MSSLRFRLTTQWIAAFCAISSTACMVDWNSYFAGTGGGAGGSATGGGAAAGGGSAAGGGGSPALCATGHALCETFDNGTWSAAWMEFAEQPLLVDGTESVSKPDSLHATCTGNCENVNSFIQAKIPREAGMNTLTCSEEMFLDGFVGDATSVLDTFGLGVDPCPTCAYLVQFSIQENGAALFHDYENTGTQILQNGDKALGMTFSQGKWHKVEIKATYSTAHTAATITIDGKTFPTQTVAPSPADTPVAILAGVSYTHGTSSSWGLHVDDVVCDWSQ